MQEILKKYLKGCKVDFDGTNKAFPRYNGIVKVSKFPEVAFDYLSTFDILPCLQHTTDVQLECLGTDNPAAHRRRMSYASLSFVAQYPEMSAWSLSTLRNCATSSEQMRAPAADLGVLRF